MYMHGHTAASQTAAFVGAFVCGVRPGVIVCVCCVLLEQDASFDFFHVCRLSTSLSTVYMHGHTAASQTVGAFVCGVRPGVIVCVCRVLLEQDASFVFFHVMSAEY